MFGTDVGLVTCHTAPFGWSAGERIVVGGRRFGDRPATDGIGTNSLCHAASTLQHHAAVVWVRIAVVCRDPQADAGRTPEAMAPIRGESHDEKAARLARRAVAFQQRARFERIVAALKADPNVLPAVEQCLQSVGALPGGVKSRKSSAKDEFDASTPVKNVADDEEAGDPAEIVGETDGDDGMAQPVLPPPLDAPAPCPLWDRNVTKLSQVPINLLKKALMSAEPVAFSAANLKSVTKRGAREPPQAYILQCVEFMTGLDAGAHIDYKYRSPVAFNQWSVELNQYVGRRARGLSLVGSAESWDDHGVFAISRESDSEISLTHRFKGMTVSLTVSPSASHSIDYNFSETKAVIQDTSSSQPTVCMTFFPSRGGVKVKSPEPEPSPDRQQNARVKAEPAILDSGRGPTTVGACKPALANDASGKAGVASKGAGRRASGPPKGKQTAAAPAPSVLGKRALDGKQAALKVSRRKTT